MTFPEAADDAGTYGSTCERCTFDQTMISFEVIPKNRGWNPATEQSVVIFPNDLAGKVYCTGCWSVYDEAGNYDRELTQRFHALMQPLGSPPGPGYAGPPDDYDEFG